MIDIDQMCADFEDCIGWPYVSPGGTGKDCSKTGIDCSGMFKRAGKLQGVSLPHSSNRMWRQSLSEKGKIETAKLQKGMAVFKWREAEHPNYRDGLGDFYHVGLVVRAKPLRIVHAANSRQGVIAVSSLKGWTHWGKLKNARYAGEEEKSMAILATVQADNGKPVNLRKEPDGQLVARVPVGTTVTVLEKDGDWYEVQAGELHGWMMRKFVTTTGYSGGQSGGGQDVGTEALRAEIEALKQRVTTLENKLNPLTNPVIMPPIATPTDLG